MMMVRSPARQRLEGDGERGSALVIALVFLVLTGVLVAALVAEATPSFETTRVVRNIQDSVAAADAGVEYGIQTLRANSTLCTDPSAGVVTLPVMPAVNGHSVAVTCQTSQGYAAGESGWGVITNDTGLSSITDQAVGNKSISGPVFDAGGWTLSKPLTVSGGDVDTRGAGCTSPISKLTVAPAAPATFTPFTQQCTPALAVPVPAHALPSAVPALAAAPTPGGGCTMTLYPGHYTAANPPPLAGDVYMASGVYYFESLGNLTVGTTLFGGQPAPGESKFSAAATPCRATDPVGADGTGVEIILGGNTTITVPTGATMELYTRTPATNDGSTPGISIYQIPVTAGGWTATPLTPATKFLTTGTAASAIGVVHGAVYGPMGSVSLTATNAATAAVGGGIDVYDLLLQSSAGGVGLEVSIATTTGLRYIIIVSVATGVGQKDITSRAVIQIANDQPRTVQVDSWRTQQDG